MVKRRAISRLEKDMRKVATPDQPVGTESIVYGMEKLVAIVEGIWPLREIVEARRLDEEGGPVGEREARLKGRSADPRARIRMREVVDDHLHVRKSIGATPDRGDVLHSREDADHDPPLDRAIPNRIALECRVFTPERGPQAQAPAAALLHPAVEAVGRI